MTAWKFRLTAMSCVFTAFAGFGANAALVITTGTTTQLQSGLPTGFNAAVWGRDAGINGGRPYLLANAPD